MIPGWLRARRQKVLERLNLDLRDGRFDLGGLYSGWTGTYTASRSKQDRHAEGLTRDVAFNRHSMNDGHHISPYDNGNIQVGTDGIEVKLVQGLDMAALKRTLSMATRATIGLDLSAPLPGDWEPCANYEVYAKAAAEEGRSMVLGEWSCVLHDTHRMMAMYRANDPGGRYQGQVRGGDWEEMLKGGLQTALESQVIVFAVSGVSRTATHQIVRSRRAAFHQQSQRASYYGDRPETRMPESIWRNPRARASFLAAVEASHNAYRVACEEDVSYQDARFALLEGTNNYIMMEYTLREFLAVYAYRGCSMFQWEIVAVMRKARALLVEAYPWLEPYIKISCEKTSGARDGDSYGPDVDPEKYSHTCTFQGWERVEGQCDFPWARDSNRSFRSEAHEIGGRKPLPLQVKEAE